MKLSKTYLLIGTLLIASGMLMANTPELSMDKEDQTEVVVYPNPVTDGIISVRTDLEIKRIEIVSVVGQIVFSKELENSNSARLNLNQVQSGIYLMHISFSNSTSSTQRIWVK